MESPSPPPEASEDDNDFDDDDDDEDADTSSSAITHILQHFSVPFPSFDHFSVMCVIGYATVKQSEAQFRLRQSGTATPPTPSTPYTSAPSSSTSRVTLKDIMAQLQGMDARLDTLSTELYQVNTYVGCIARRQAHLGGFMESPSPPLEASEDDDDSNNDDDDDEDGDASLPRDDEMST